MIGLLKDVSLRTKITVSFVLIVVCGASLSTFIGSRIITNAMLNEAQKQLRHGLEAAEIAYEEHLGNVRASVAGAAASEELAETLRAEGPARLQGTLEALRTQSNLHFLTFVNLRQERVFHASREGTQKPESLVPPLSRLVELARAGGNPAGSEVLRWEALLDEDAALLRLSQSGSSPEEAGKEEDANGRREAGLALVAAAPVAVKGEVAGVLYGGISLNRNVALVSEINRLVLGGGRPESRDPGTISIFMGNRRISASPDISGTGRTASHAVSRAVLERGERWYDRDYAANEWQLAAYAPLHDHAHRIVGILHVGIPEKPFLEVRTSMMLTFLFVAAAGVLVVLGLTYLITRSMIHPLEEIAAASNRIAAGDLNHSVHVSSHDEIGILSGSFNKMVASIKTMKLELEEWGRTLEEKVKARTEELVAVQTKMAQSEKLASIGRLSAGVAHEINNPLGGILAFSMLALEECDDKHPLRKNLEIIVKQTLRCRETVKGLLDFARQSTAAAALTDVNSIVDKTFSLLENQAIFHNIRTVRKFEPDLPPVLIDAGQLQQIVINIVINAVDAMKESGVLTVTTESVVQSQEVLIRISDTGKGIPEDVLPFIFEPFFTTKKVGEGTGLGLSIVHGIVTGAGGKVEAANIPEGATFTVHLPMGKEESADESTVEGRKNVVGRPGERSGRG
jgi:two-component system, NtrC family, sensor kinase